MTLGDDREPALDLVQPRGIGGRVVDVVTPPIPEPGSHFRMLVGGVVIDDEMHVEVRRHIRIDMLEEGEELLVTMLSPALGQHLTIGNVESGEQRRRPVPDIIVGDALDVAEPERQDRLRSLERLDLALSSTHRTIALSGGLR